MVLNLGLKRLEQHVAESAHYSGEEVVDLQWQHSTKNGCSHDESRPRIEAALGVAKAGAGSDSFKVQEFHV